MLKSRKDSFFQLEIFNEVLTSSEKDQAPKDRPLKKTELLHIINHNVFSLLKSIVK